MSVCVMFMDSQRTKANKQAIESLVPRVETLARQLHGSIPEGDVSEVERRKKLEE